MKNLTLLIIFVSVFACSTKQVEIVEMEIKNDLYYLEGEIKPYTGACVIYFENSKQIKELRHFLKGRVHGSAITFYPNGNMKRKGHYLNGKMNGTWIQWTEENVKVVEVNYKLDKMDGAYKTWFSNGNLKESGYYADNQRTGEWQNYQRNTDTVKTAVF